MKPVPVYSVEAVADGYLVKRDSVSFRTPAGVDFRVPSAALAEAIAAEARLQTAKIDAATMPMTQFAATTLDITTKESARVVAQLLSYADTEMLCHRADEPDALIRRQHEIWQPLLDWCASICGASYAVGAGIMPIRQDAALRDALRARLETYDAWRLTGLSFAADCMGSLVLGLAFAEGRLTAAQAFDAAELDALFQMQKWGEDSITQQKHEILKRDLDQAERWFTFLRG